MKKEDLMRAIGEIDEKYIEEAAPNETVRTKRKWYSYIPLAAAVCVLAAGAALALRLGGTMKKADVQYAETKACAANEADGMAEEVAEAAEETVPMTIPETMEETAAGAPAEDMEPAQEKEADGGNIASEEAAAFCEITRETVEQNGQEAVRITVRLKEDDAEELYVGLSIPESQTTPEILEADGFTDISALDKRYLPDTIVLKMDAGNLNAHTAASFTAGPAEALPDQLHIALKKSGEGAYTDFYYEIGE